MADLSLSLSALVATWFTPSSLFIFLNLVIATIAISTRFGATHHDSPPTPSLLERVRSFRLTHDPAPTLATETELTQQQQHHQLVRTPSLLERVRSFRLTHDPAPTIAAEPEFTQQQQQPQLVRTPSLLERVRSFNFGSTYKCEQSPSNAAEAEHPQPNQLPEPENPKQPQLTRAPSLLQRLQSMNFSRLYKSESINGEEKPEPETEVSDPVREGGNDVVEIMRKSASERRGSSSVTREWEEEVEGVVERRRPMTARSETTSFRGEDEEVDARADDFINRFKKQLRLQRVDSILRYREMLRGNSR